MSNSTNTGEDLAPAVQLPNFVNTHEIKGSGDDQPDLIIETGVVSKVEYLTNVRDATIRSVGDIGGAVASVAGAALESTAKTVVRGGVAGFLTTRGAGGFLLGQKIMENNNRDNPFEKIEFGSQEGQTIDHYAKIEFIVAGNRQNYLWKLQSDSETINVGDVISVVRRKNKKSVKITKNLKLKEGKEMAKLLAPFSEENYPAHINHSTNVYLNKAEHPKLPIMEVLAGHGAGALLFCLIAFLPMGGLKGRGFDFDAILVYLLIVGGWAFLGWLRLFWDAKKQKYPAYIEQAITSNLPVAEEDTGLSQDIKIVEKELAKKAENIRLGVDDFRSGRLSDIPSHFSSNLGLPYDKKISTAPEIQVYTGVVTDIKERKTIVSNELAHDYIDGKEVVSTDNLEITDQIVVLENGEESYRLPSSTGFFREVLAKEEFKKEKWKMDYCVTAAPVEIGDVISVYRIESYDSLVDKKSKADPTNPNDTYKYLTLAVVKHLTTGQHLQTVPSPLKGWIQGRDEKKELFGNRKNNVIAIDEKWLEVLNQPVGEFYKSTR